MKARAHTLFQQTLLGDAGEHAQIGLMVWNEERRYVAINTCACEILGVTREELLGSHVGDHNRSDAARDAIDATIASTGSHGRIELPNGKVVDWLTVPTDIAGLPHFLGVMWEAHEN